MNNIIDAETLKKITLWHEVDHMDWLSIAERLPRFKINSIQRAYWRDKKRKKKAEVKKAAAGK